MSAGTFTDVEAPTYFKCEQMRIWSCITERRVISSYPLNPTFIGKTGVHRGIH